MPTVLHIFQLAKTFQSNSFAACKVLVFLCFCLAKRHARMPRTDCCPCGTKLKLCLHRLYPIDSSQKSLSDCEDLAPYLPSKHLIKLKENLTLHLQNSNDKGNLATQMLKPTTHGFSKISSYLDQKPQLKNKIHTRHC